MTDEEIADMRKRIDELVKDNEDLRKSLKDANDTIRYLIRLIK